MRFSQRASPRSVASMICDRGPCATSSKLRPHRSGASPHSGRSPRRGWNRASWCPTRPLDAPRRGWGNPCRLTRQGPKRGMKSGPRRAGWTSDIGSAKWPSPVQALTGKMRRKRPSIRGVSSVHEAQPPRPPATSNAGRRWEERPILSRSSWQMSRTPSPLDRAWTCCPPVRRSESSHWKLFLVEETRLIKPVRQIAREGLVNLRSLARDTRPWERL